MEVQQLKKQSGFANWSEEGETALREIERLGTYTQDIVRTTEAPVILTSCLALPLQQISLLLLISSAYFFLILHVFIQ